MKTFKVEVPEGYEIDKEKSTFENILFKKIGNKYPTKIEEVKGRDWDISATGCVYKTKKSESNQVSSLQRAGAFVVMMQLVELRDAWNEIDGGKEFVYRKKNYVIEIYDYNIFKNFYYDKHSVLHFRKESTRDLFLETFKELIEEAKELI